MIVQACINGARPADFHAALPLDPDAMARDGAASIASGAAELHVHARGADGQESLAPEATDRTVAALRRACPGTLIGVSTGAWIEKDDLHTLVAIVRAQVSGYGRRNQRLLNQGSWLQCA